MKFILRLFVLVIAIVLHPIKSSSVTFYAVQTVSPQGCVSGGMPSELEFEIRGSGLVAGCTIDDNLMDIAASWPGFSNIINSTYNSNNYDGGIFAIDPSGLILYYINEDKGYLNAMYYMSPGNPNSFLRRVYYSTDPSLKNTGASGSFGNSYMNNSDGNSSFSSPNSSRSSQKANCSICHGTGYDPTPYTYSASSDSYHNTSGYNCPICNRTSEHYHYRCRH